MTAAECHADSAWCSPDGGARYLVYRCNQGTGLGHNLFSIDRCAGFARSTGRGLAIDFRDIPYFSNDAQAGFLSCFEPVASGGLEVIVDPDDIDRIYALTDRRVLSHESIVFDAQKDYSERVVLVFGAFCELAGTTADGKRSHLTFSLKPPLRDDITSTITRAFRDRPMVGVHFRHGNGEALHGRVSSRDAAFAIVYDRIKEEYVQKVHSVAESLSGDSIGVFVASDSTDFVRFVSARVPGAVTLATDLPDRPYLAFLRDRGRDLRIFRDAVLDLWALARCDKLVCGSSSFSLAAVLQSRRLGPADVVTIEQASANRLAEFVPIAIRIRDAEQKVAGAPLDLAFKRELADLYRSAGREADAANVGKQISSRFLCVDNPYCSIALLNALSASGQTDAAIAAARKGVGCNPNDAALHYRLGQLLVRTGRAQEGESHMELAIRLVPEAGRNAVILATTFGGLPLPRQK